MATFMKFWLVSEDRPEGRGVPLLVNIDQLIEIQPEIGLPNNVRLVSRSGSRLVLGSYDETVRRLQNAGFLFGREDDGT